MNPSVGCIASFGRYCKRLETWTFFKHGISIIGFGRRLRVILFPQVIWRLDLHLVLRYTKKFGPKWQLSFQHMYGDWHEIVGIMLLHLCVPSFFIAAFTGYFQGQHEANAKAICVAERSKTSSITPLWTHHCCGGWDEVVKLGPSFSSCSMSCIPGQAKQPARPTKCQDYKCCHLKVPSGRNLKG